MQNIFEILNELERLLNRASHTTLTIHSQEQWSRTENQEHEIMGDIDHGRQRHTTRGAWWWWGWLMDAVLQGVDVGISA